MTTTTPSCIHGRESEGSITAWLESHQELREHPKTARLRRRLGVSLPTAIGHLHLLWWWALDYAPSGHLSAYDPDVIADAAGWQDDPSTFVRALIGAGFLNDDMTIHDWDDYAGRLLDRREANAKRKRTARQTRRAELLLQAASGGHPAGAMPDISRTGLDHPVPVRGLPDLTGPDLTGPDRTTTPLPPPHAEGARPNGNQRRRRRSTPETAPPTVREVPDDLTPASPSDRELWESARASLSDGWLPANAAMLAAFEPLGRDASGCLWIRAPLWASTVAPEQQLAAALCQAGDDGAGRVTVVVG